MLTRLRTGAAAGLITSCGFYGFGIRNYHASRSDNLDDSPMMANQHKLPRLPLPTLDDTLDRYLKAVEPLVSSSEFETTRRVVAEALAPASTLRALQAELVARDESRRELSYVSRQWDDMYLGLRCSVALNSNPGAVTRTKGLFDAASTSQVARAARMIVANVIFSQRVDSGDLAPDVMRGVPLDMRQYPKMFAATRLPRVGKDVLHKAPPGTSRHVVVLRGEAFWELPVFDASTGEPLTVEQIEMALQTICDATPSSGAASGSLSSAASSPPSLAVLTTCERDEWARLRARLEAHSAANVTSLEAIDDAILLLSLDEADVGTTGGAEPRGEQLLKAERLALCGDARTAPRWMDKSFSLGVTADGVPTFHFEHSWGDGIPCARAGGETARMIAEDALPHSTGASGASAHAPEPRRLVWDVPNDVADAVRRQDERFARVCASLDLSILTFDKFGSSQLKAWGISPDGVAQAAIALAFHRIEGRMAATYESATTAHFSGGRTETIRPATAACREWVEGAIEGIPLAEQAARLRASAKAHSAVARAAAGGKGFDRHLFALRRLADETGEPTPRLFTDSSYAHLAGNELSTSTVTLAHTLNSGFGPVHPEGYGVFYFYGGSAGKGMRFCASAYRPKSAERMAKEIEAALTHVQAVLEADARTKA